MSSPLFGAIDERRSSVRRLDWRHWGTLRHIRSTFLSSSWIHTDTHAHTLSVCLSAWTHMHNFKLFFVCYFFSSLRLQLNNVTGRAAATLKPVRTYHLLAEGNPSGPRRQHPNRLFCPQTFARENLTRVRVLFRLAARVPKLFARKNERGGGHGRQMQPQVSMVYDCVDRQCVSTRNRNNGGARLEASMMK